MTQTSWPFQGVDTTETQYSRLLRHVLTNGRSGVNGVPGDNNLKVIGDSSGMQVKVKIAGGNSQAIIRGHMFNSTSEETLTIDTADTNPRVDLVVLELDPSADSIILKVIKGVPAVSPSTPGVTQTDTGIFQLPIGAVQVPANATTIDANSVSDLRVFIMDVWTTSVRPAPVIGLSGFNTTNGRFETYNGTAWKTIPVEGDPIAAAQLSAEQQLLLNVGRINGSKFSVQQTAPTSPNTGDIWFW